MTAFFMGLLICAASAAGSGSMYAGMFLIVAGGLYMLVKWAVGREDARTDRSEQ